MDRAYRSARRYRAFAEELRTIAEYDTREETREVLVRVADDYERVAQSMELILESYVVIRNPSPDSDTVQ